VTNVKRIIREYYKQLHAKKLKNLDEMDKFCQRQDYQSQCKKLIVYIVLFLFKKIESVVFKFLVKKPLHPGGFPGEFY
jgi:uncharacterized protein (UPF0305 family)